MTKKEMAKLYSKVFDAVLDGNIIVFDMKRSALEDAVDVCMNGNAIQLTIRPVIRKSKRKGTK